MTEDETEELTEEERALLKQAMAEYGSPEPEEKHNVWKFLDKVATSNDTTKTGNITVEELGNTEFTERTLKQCALISRDVIGNTHFENYFNAEAEIITSTSLSKEGFLDRLAITSNRNIENKTARKKNKGWFKKEKTEPIPI